MSASTTTSQNNVAYIIYNKRTCVTGKALFDYLKENRVGGYRWRRSNKLPPKNQAGLVLRWGNSLHDVEGGYTIINSQEAVSNATNKLTMITKLRERDDVSTPRVITREDSQESTIDVGEIYVRDRNDHVRNDTTFRSDDKYFTYPIDKVMELRVHVFADSTIGVYEKMPYEEGAKIYKDENCRFRRVDVSDEDQRQSIKGARPLARRAVEALGLTFGGVDVVKDSESNWYVLEVNSAPSLNSVNIERWGNKIDSYIKSIE